MPWIPNTREGISIDLDKTKFAKLQEVVELISDLEDSELEPELWGQAMLEQGATFRIWKKYKNYEWTIPSPDGRHETRIAYVEKGDRRMLSIRNWFKTGEDG